MSLLEKASPSLEGLDLEDFVRVFLKVLANAPVPSSPYRTTDEIGSSGLVSIERAGVLMFKLMKRFRKNESGATAIEYGLIAALVGVAIITTVGQVGTDLGLTFTEVSNALTGTAPNGGGN